ncbi:MAG: hypothetical protein ACLFTT_04365 [Candidatus Hydrogenedentota bacterium]
MSADSPMSTPREDTVYVLGSGVSMRRLSDEERRFLNTRTTVGMNKYLLFWDLLDVYPTHYFLADIHYPALRVYEESVQRVEETGKPVHFLLDQTYRKRYGAGLLKRLFNTPFRVGVYRRHGYWYNPAVMPARVTYFKRCHRWRAPEQWGTSLDDLMFFWRGSLSCLINLLTVIGLGRRIKLLGVDLNTAGSFFDDALETRPYLLDPYMKMQGQGQRPRHFTAMPHQGMPGIQAKWPFIQENVRAQGYELYCCNPDSLLVREGLCPYAPVME